MFVYSKKIIQFMNVIKHVVKEVLLHEVGLKVAGNRFYDHQERCSYPINVVIYNDKSMLGYFDSNFYEMGFHECLMNACREQLDNVIRHEVAHYMTFIHHGALSSPHSDEFRAFCRGMGWGEEVQRATLRVESKLTDSQREESSILRKVRKLLALASSSNVHEAEQAMIMSQQLLLKHHIEDPLLDEKDEDRVVLKRIMKQKRMNAKIEAIAKILVTFFVSVVYRRAGEYTYLEVMGESINVDIAEYVADVLDRELDILWDQAQKSSCVRGIVARNSFFTGVAKGYCKRVQSLKRDSTGDVSNALMVIEKKLADARAMVYRHVTSNKRSVLYCQNASLLGEKMGGQLTINPAINATSDGSEIFLLR